MKKFWIRALTALLLTVLLAVTATAGEPVWHGAYLNGFPDGTIRPESLFTREQLAAVLYRMLTEEAREEYGSRETCFLDVPPGRWSYEAVTVAAELGLLFGDETGRFQPQGGVSRTDLALVLNLVVHTDAAAVALPALSACWAGAEVTFAAGNGWVIGFDGTEFRPDEPLTRAEAVQILNGVLDRQPQEMDDLLVGMPLWQDNLDSGAWYFLDMQEASTPHTAWEKEMGERWAALG